MSETGGEGAVNATTPAVTWPNLQETLQFERAATAIMNDRPHTISTGIAATDPDVAHFLISLWNYRTLPKSTISLGSIDVQ